MTTLLNRCLTALLLLFSLNAANAAYTDCSGVIAGLVDGAVGCEISDATQDFLNTAPLTVNEDGGFFSIADWMFIGKDEGANGDGLGQAGEWNLAANVWSLYDNIMLVFKGGRDTRLVGYLLDGQTTSGDWLSPFRAPDFDVRNVKDVSHISFYGTQAAVPEPSALMLLSLGLVGLGAIRRGRGKSA